MPSGDIERGRQYLGDRRFNQRPGPPGTHLTTNFAIRASPLLLPIAGRVVTQIAIPADANLIGLVVFEQLLDVELGAAGLTRLAASNALQIVIGSN